MPQAELGDSEPSIATSSAALIFVAPIPQLIMSRRRDDATLGKPIEVGGDRIRRRPKIKFVLGPVRRGVAGRVPEIRYVGSRSRPDRPRPEYAAEP